MKHLLLSAIFLVSSVALADGWNGKWAGEGHMVSTKHGHLHCQEVLYETTQSETTLTIHAKKTCGEGEGQVSHEHNATYTIDHGALLTAEGTKVGTITDNTIHVSAASEESTHNCVAVRKGAHLKLEGSHTHGHNAGHFSAFLTAVAE